VAKHVATAQVTCPTLAGKRITTHSLRHSLAMELLRNGLDVAVVALWLGHEKLESVNAYVHADPTLKERRWIAHTAQSHGTRAVTSRPTTCSPSSKASRSLRNVIDKLLSMPRRAGRSW